MIQVCDAFIVVGLSFNCGFLGVNFEKIKAAYRRKVFDSHPDRIPIPEKARAESEFNTIVLCTTQHGHEYLHFLIASDPRMLNKAKLTLVMSRDSYIVGWCQKIL